MAEVRVEVDPQQTRMLQRLQSGLLFCAAAALLLMTQASAEAQVRYASEKRSNAAIAHYARARAMCVETLEEFEVGRKHARPDLLLDAEEWRLTMISLCEQLNRLIDPKIRVSNAGIQVSANPRLIHRAEDRLPQVVDGPKIRNDYGEAERMKQQQDARARMFKPEDAPATQEPSAQDVDEPAAEEQAEAQPELSEEELIEQAIQAAIDAEEEELGLDEEETIEDEQQAREPREPMIDPNAPLAPREQIEEEIAQEQLRETVEQEMTEELEQEGAAARQVPQEDAREIPSEEQDLSATEKEPVNGEDAKIASAIEQQIQQKLAEIEGAGSQPQVETEEEFYEEE